MGARHRPTLFLALSFPAGAKGWPPLDGKGKREKEKAAPLSSPGFFPPLSLTHRWAGREAAGAAAALKKGAPLRGSLAAGQLSLLFRAVGLRERRERKKPGKDSPEPFHFLSFSMVFDKKMKEMGSGLRDGNTLPISCWAGPSFPSQLKDIGRG